MKQGRARCAQQWHTSSRSGDQREISLMVLPLCVISNILKKKILIVNTAVRFLWLFPMEPLKLMRVIASNNNSSKASGWMVEEMILV